MNRTKLDAVHLAIRNEVNKIIVGQDEALRLLVIGLLTGGHVLLEGPPGTAKTLLGRVLARTTSLQFNRIQFTPDLMPGDVIGSNIFNFNTSKFELILGPIFTELLLADEINRAPPKTQSALLEAMNERAVTIDGETRRLSDGFMVVGTQNPIEQQGTYPLPEAQLDRFMFMHILSYPERNEEFSIVFGNAREPDLQHVQPVLSLEHIGELRNVVAEVHLSEEVAAYIVDLVRATRAHALLSYGASPRSAVMISRAARAAAALEGRDFVIPDDVKSLVLPTLRHRVILSPSAEIDGLTTDDVLTELVQQSEAPR